MDVAGGQVIRRHPRGDVGRRLAALEHPHPHLRLGPLDQRRIEGVLLGLIQQLQHGLFCLLNVLRGRLHHDRETSLHISRGGAGSVNAGDQLLAIANLAHQQRTLAIGKHAGKKIQCVQVGVVKLHRWKLDADFRLPDLGHRRHDRARGEHLGLRRQVVIEHPPRRGRCQLLLKRLEHLLRFQITRHHEHHVARLIGAAVIRIDIIAGEPLDDFLIADHRHTGRRNPIAVHRHQIVKLSRRLTPSHLQFSLHHLIFAPKLVRRDGRPQHPAGQQIDGIVQIRRRGIDEIGGVIRRGISVGVVADFLQQRAILGLGAPLRRPPGHQVFQQVRQPATQPLAFIDAAGPDIAAHRQHRRSGHPLGDHHRPILQHRDDLIARRDDARLFGAVVTLRQRRGRRGLQRWR